MDACVRCSSVLTAGNSQTASTRAFTSGDIEINRPQMPRFRLAWPFVGGIDAHFAAQSA